MTDRLFNFLTKLQLIKGIMKIQRKIDFGMLIV